MAWFDNHETQGFLWTPSNPGGHSGIDLGMPEGTALTALLPGFVMSEGKMPWGGQINMQCDWPGLGPLVLTYLHTKINLLHAGDHFKPGQTVALSGSPPLTGPNAYRYGNGPHCHFEVSRGEQPPYMGHNGPSSPIDGEFILQAARMGQLDASPNILMGGLTGIGAQANKGVSHAPGFLPIVQALDRGERIVPFDPGNMGGVVAHNAAAVATRGIVVVTGLMLLMIVAWNLMRAQAGEAVQMAGTVSRITTLGGAI